MKKRNLFLILLLTAKLCVPISTNAQVTIGGNQVPQPFSVLEIIVADPENRPQGFRLPRMTTNQRREMENSPEFQANYSTAARGLQIYNLDNNCVETWNGRIWLLDCQNTTPGHSPMPPPPFPPFRPERPGLPDIYCDGIGGRLIPGVRFAPRNLGADPRYNTAIAQMRYLAVAPFDVNDATIHGGLFQWGRAAHHYAWYVRESDGRHRRQLRQPFIAAAPGNVEINIYTGQPIRVNNQNADYRFFRLNTNPPWPLAHDWQPEPRRLNLWGSGVPIQDPFVVPQGITCHELGGVTGTSGRCYQVPMRGSGDPCPPGWRLPTQDELERISPYDCDPTRINLANNSVTGAGVVRNAPYGLIWIRVQCGGPGVGSGVCRMSPHIVHNVHGGWALYEQSLWDEFTVGMNLTQQQQLNLLADGAPEPFLFFSNTGYRDGWGSITNNFQGYFWTSSRRNNVVVNMPWPNNTIADGSTTPFALRTGENSFDMASGGNERDPVNGLAVRCVSDLGNTEPYPDFYSRNPQN